ncbi:HAD family hydrolase [Halolamina litorea]|uniref:HAD family hydrolase n=1 Tax=Halolamina litorea TaxID=1515593 RepID=A0ABD6BTV6_9EURY|nr:HAD family hydrolase [Halolamina litorea]
MYDFWLLDLDGTVVDVEPRYRYEVFEAVGDRLGRSFTDQEVETLWHGLGGPRSEKLAAMGLDPGTFWPALHEAEDPGARAEATYIHDDAAALLDDLDQAGVPVGVVTHCAPFLADRVVDDLGLRSRFDAFVTCSDDLGWKPDPEPVRHTMNELGVGKAGSGVLAGDGPSDVGAAWNAGLDAVHVERHGHDNRGQCVLADHRVERFTDLDDAVLGG